MYVQENKFNQKGICGANVTAKIQIEQILINMYVSHKCYPDMSSHAAALVDAMLVEGPTAIGPYRANESA